MLEEEGIADTLADRVYSRTASLHRHLSPSPQRNSPGFWKSLYDRLARSFCALWPRHQGHGHFNRSNEASNLMSEEAAVLVSQVQNDLLIASVLPSDAIASDAIVCDVTSTQQVLVYHPLLAAIPHHPLASVPVHLLARMLPKHPTGPLLPPALDAKPCLVLDLDETLVHAGFSVPPIPPDLVLHLDIPSGVAAGEQTVVYVCKRPSVDAFLAALAQHFEVVVFTASLAEYANPVIDRLLDPSGSIVTHRLFRDACVPLHGLFVKDLDRLGRHPDRTLLVDNSPVSFLLHPEAAVACHPWYWHDGAADAELPALLPLLLALARECGGSVAGWRSRMGVPRGRPVELGLAFRSVSFQRPSDDVPLSAIAGKRENKPQ